MRTVSLEKSVAMIDDGASLMVCGFMIVGTPEHVTDEIVRRNKRNVAIIANDTAAPDRGMGKLTAALVQAFLGDYIGNLSYALTARNITGCSPARETTPGISVPQVLAATEAELEVPNEVPEMAL
jgi:acyl CoA:acetate/3-ketoacid CoA transferase alpha subunit